MKLWEAKLELLECRRKWIADQREHDEQDAVECHDDERRCKDRKQ